MKYKYEKQEVVWVYEESKIGNRIGIICGVDPLEKIYEIQDISRPGNTVFVAEDNLFKLELKKPSFFGKLKMCLFN